jgi:hypothetical protein
MISSSNDTHVIALHEYTFAKSPLFDIKEMMGAESIRIQMENDSVLVLVSQILFTTGK